jgi:hypothetical protein
LNAITVTEVAAQPLSGDLLAGAHVDAPTTGFATPSYALDVAGWAVAGDVPVTAIELIQKGVCIRRVPIDIERADIAERFPDRAGAASAGFFASTGGVTLDRRFEVLVRARLEDRTRVPIATIRGDRAALLTGYEPALSPLSVTTLGRTGSTALVRMLGSHPAIVAYRPFEYEPRVASYWLGVLRSLADPASHRRQLAPAGPIDGAWWLGTDPPYPRRVKDPELGHWIGGESVSALAAFCQSRIDGLYGEVARLQQREGAVLFAEKQRPDFVPELLGELYPSAREVILARDFRDMVASMFAFNTKRGFQGFRRQASSTDAEFIQERVGNSVAALARALRERAERAHLVRYEDLVLRPEETAQALLAYLGLDSSPEIVSEMTASVTRRGDMSDGHRTVSDPAESIGRWRTDLSAELQEAAEAALGDALREFGYEEAVR